MKEMLTPSRRNHCELKKKTVIFDLCLAVHFLKSHTTPPPKASWSILRPYILWIAWRSGPKNIKTKIKLPKQSPQTIKSATKKNGYIAVLAPLSSQVFFFEKLLLFWLSGALIAETFSGQLPDTTTGELQTRRPTASADPLKKRTRLSVQHLCKRFQETTHERT